MRMIHRIALSVAIVAPLWLGAFAAPAQAGTDGPMPIAASCTSKDKSQSCDCKGKCVGTEKSCSCWDEGESGSEGASCSSKDGKQSCSCKKKCVSTQTSCSCWD